MKSNKFLSDRVLRSHCNPEWWALAVAGQSVRGIVWDLDRNVILYIVTPAPVTASCPLVSYSSWRPPPAPRAPAGWKLCRPGPTCDPGQPIRGRVTRPSTNESSANSLRCDAGHYVWCLGVSQTRHKSYRSHNKEDDRNIWSFFLLWISGRLQHFVW